MNIPEKWTNDTVHANGIELQYYRNGDGPPLVMAHGFYDNGRCLLPLADDLAADYDVVTYDARGHGRSDAPETGYDVESRVADLVELVDELGIDDPILFGHSMGGATVAWAAAMHPDLPRALLLEDPEGLLDTPEVEPDERARMVRNNLAGGTDRSVEELATDYDEFAPDVARRHAVADTELSPNIAEIARSGYPTPLKEVFDDIACPTLVLRSDADTARRVRDLKAADALANGRLVHVPDTGHYLFHDEYDAAHAELRAFLRRT
ncbi:alpha/beta hydrolase [Halococcus dombrowskii]|uniref:Alpha/beta hydrolase n=1 Tax=Halococcus dombrowskii TaxID=179637 RepID=A0AAV3SLE1_HALDO|nr:alpha/beta hydrolase [Halococcus dombrowskii]UOO95802.1 alpha/beta hydrolase [Halococcus dombrowskii]